MPGEPGAPGDSVSGAARRVKVLPPPDSETNCSWGSATRRSIPFSSLRMTDAFVSESVLGVTPPPQRLVFLEASRLRLAEVEELLSRASRASRRARCERRTVRLSVVTLSVLR